VLAVIAASATAAADPAPGPLVLRDGQLAAQLVLEVSLDLSYVGDPTSLAPDLWWGVTPRLTIGVIHSDPSLDQVGVDATFCVRYTTYRCSGPYKGDGLDARWLAIDGPIAVAPRIRAIMRDIDPDKPALTLGALARWTHSWFSITGDPYLRLGLANQQDGNRAALYVPIWFGARIDSHWDVAIHTGYDSDLDVAADGYHVPITLDRA
jgi:hypothetical protein